MIQLKMHSSVSEIIFFVLSTHEQHFVHSANPNGHYVIARRFASDLPFLLHRFGRIVLEHLVGHGPHLQKLLQLLHLEQSVD